MLLTRPGASSGRGGTGSQTSKTAASLWGIMAAALGRALALKVAAEALVERLVMAMAQPSDRRVHEGMHALSKLQVAVQKECRRPVAACMQQHQGSP